MTRIQPTWPLSLRRRSAQALGRCRNLRPIFAAERLVQQLSDDALKIVYLTYEMPPGRMTWDVTPDKQGNIWCLYIGTVNGVSKLNPETGELNEYRIQSDVSILMLSR